MGSDATEKPDRLPAPLEDALAPYEVTGRHQHRDEVRVWARNGSRVACVRRDPAGPVRVTLYLDTGDGLQHSDTATYRCAATAGRRVVAFLHPPVPQDAATSSTPAGCDV